MTGRIQRFSKVASLVVLLPLLSITARADADVTGLEAELKAVETAFAKTMADRDHDAFARFLSDEAIFFGGAGALRGKSAVAEAWRPFFEGDAAPFSWAPDEVVVLESGGLGLTSGPVKDPDGNTVAIFNSVWRRNADGTWRIVLDRGCECP